jgi:hypothetical protein
MEFIHKWLTRLSDVMASMVQQPGESIDHPLQDEYNEYT